MSGHTAADYPQCRLADVVCDAVYGADWRTLTARHGEDVPPGTVSLIVVWAASVYALLLVLNWWRPAWVAWRPAPLTQEPTRREVVRWLVVPAAALLGLAVAFVRRP